MPPYSPNTQNQTVSYGGQTWKGDPGSGWHLASTDSRDASYSGGAYDPVATAQKMLDFQKTANVPVVQALQGQTSSIKDKYTELVNSIKGNQQVSENAQTLTTNNELGRRGISGGGLYDQSLTSALLPVQSAYSGQIANTEAGSITDLNNLALQIAQLQAGNADTAMSQSMQYGGLQNQAASLAQQLYLGTYQSPTQTAQANYYNALASGKLSTQLNDPMGLFS